MRIFAAAGSLEEGFAGFGVGGQQLLDWIDLGNFGGAERFCRARVEKGGDVGDLFVGEGHRWHALVGSAVANDLADEIALDVVGDQRRANQGGAAGAGGIRAVTKSAGLLELVVPALHCRIRSMGLRESAAGSDGED